MRQFSVAVPVAARVSARVVPTADATDAVTAAASMFTAARVPAPSFVPAAARTSRWPDIPEALSDVPLSLDEENVTYIICLACQEYPQRKVIVDVKVPCAQKRHFKYQ